MLGFFGVEKGQLNLYLSDFLLGYESSWILSMLLYLSLEAYDVCTPVLSSLLYLPLISVAIQDMIYSIARANSALCWRR